MSAAEPLATAADRGLRAGLGLFETILCLDGRPVAWDRHLARLAASAARFGIRCPASRELRAALDQVLAADALAAKRTRARITLTGGPGPLDLTPGSAPLAWLEAAATDPPAASATAALCPWTRNERDPLAGHKCTSYAGNLVARAWAARHSLDEPLFPNTRGELCEGATTNVFFVLDGIVRTPLVTTGCLPGVTRGIVLELARAHGVPAEEGEFAAARLTDASEVFLTSATRGIQPLGRCGNRDLSAPGPLTQRLQHAYAEWLADSRT
jgi:branched-chain amino acid aminotransferase